MKRMAVLLCVLVLALNTAAAYAAELSYALPESLKTVPSSAEDLSLPDDFPDPVLVNSFTVEPEHGKITVTLDQEVPSLKVKETGYWDGVESTIFSKKNTDTAETHRTGSDDSVFIVIMTWKTDAFTFTQKYDTWSDDLAFVSAVLDEEADASLFPSADSARRELSFQEDGTLLSETWTLENAETVFSRTARYSEFGNLEDVAVSWRSAADDGSLLEAEIAPDGTLTSLRCKTSKLNFSARSIPVDDDPPDLFSLLRNSLDPGMFESQFRARYPALAEKLLGVSTGFATPESLLAATPTDLDEPVPEGEATENTRVWELTFGDSFNSTVYVFALDDPLIVIADGKAMLNPDAKDISGAAVTVDPQFLLRTPAFELPVIR